MKVILAKDIPKLGRRGTTVEVSTGYSRNFLFPRSLAFPLDDTRAHSLIHSLRQQHARAELLARKSAALVAKLRSQVFEFKRPANSLGHLYAAVSSAEIAAAISAYLKALIGAEAITLAGPIKKLGQHRVTCVIGNHTATVTVDVKLK